MDRRVTVELPAGFEAAEAGDGRKHIFRGSDCYELTANADGVPCIIDHTPARRAVYPAPDPVRGLGHLTISSPPALGYRGGFSAFMSSTVFHVCNPCVISAHGSGFWPSIAESKSLFLESSIH